MRQAAENKAPGETGRSKVKQFPGYQPPANPEAEQSVLGAVLVRPEILDRLVDWLSPDDFYREVHGRIFQAMLDLYADNKPVDLVTVTALLKERGQLEGIGGSVFLAGLSEQVGFATNCEYYAGLVHDKAILRRLLDVSQEIAGACLARVENVPQFLDASEQKVFEVAQSVRMEGGFRVQDLLAGETQVLAELQKSGRPPGLSTGFTDLDKLVAWQPGDFILVAARPSLGKTALVMNLITQAAKSGEPVAMFSLEMSKGQITRRFLAQEGRLDLHRLNRGRLTAPEWETLHRARQDLEPLPIWIDDSPGLSVLELRARVRRRAREGLSLVVVDYVQLMRSTKKTRTREEEISEISGGLKGLAKELPIPVIAVSQLSREPEKRPGKKPQLSDLRDSGSLEQDADIVLFIHREKSPDPGVAEIMIEKHRNGPIGLVKLTYLPVYTRFEDHWGEQG